MRKWEGAGSAGKERDAEGPSCGTCVMDPLLVSSTGSLSLCLAITVIPIQYS